MFFQTRPLCALTWGGLLIYWILSQRLFYCERDSFLKKSHWAKRHFLNFLQFDWLKTVSFRETFLKCIKSRNLKSLGTVLWSKVVEKDFVSNIEKANFGPLCVLYSTSLVRVIRANEAFPENRRQSSRRLRILKSTLRENQQHHKFNKVVFTQLWNMNQMRMLLIFWFSIITMAFGDGKVPNYLQISFWIIRQL